MRHLRSDCIWEGGGYFRIPCLECRQNFSARRRDALYCSDTCRKRANRRRQSILVEAESIVNKIRHLEQLQRERDDLQGELYRALKMIRDAAAVPDATR